MLMWFQYSPTLLAASTLCSKVYTLSEANASFSSPGFPNYYRYSKDICWTIKAAAGHNIWLKFSSFHLPSYMDCTIFGVVEVRDGHNVSGTLLGRYCGFQAPFTVYSSDRYMWIKFKSDEHVNLPGFQAFFTTDTTKGEIYI